jgi:hypothetical protein
MPLRSLVGEGRAMKSLRGRLSRLERQVGRPPTAQDIQKMSAAELFRLAGLPPDPGWEEIDALIAALKEDLGRAAPSMLAGNP